MTIDLNQLPPPKVVEELSFESLVTEHKQALLDRQPSVANVINLESEPLVKQLQVFAYREMLIRQRINQAARSNLLAYAQDTDLDHKGAFYDLARLSNENDDRYRQRIQYRIAALAGNGTPEQYRLIAMTASQNVRDSNVYLISPGVVGLVLWCVDANLAVSTQEVVVAALSAPNAKPIGIQVVVRVAVQKTIDITATLYRDEIAPSNIVQFARNALVDSLRSYAKLGRNISNSWITSVLQQPGISRVAFINGQPDIHEINFDEYAVVGQIIIIDGGVE
nr:baseplate J/gp47 family protein [uncultured Undibacterium sp.]